MVKSNKKGLKDPADEIDYVDDRLTDPELVTFDPERQNDPMPDNGLLDIGEVGAIQERRSSAPHPFDGYQLGRKIKVGKVNISSTYIVMVKPSEEPPPDRSNDGITIYVSGEAGGGGSPEQGKAKTVTLPTSHSRVAPNREGTNESVVFDREIELRDGVKYHCAVIPSHAVRAQICFYWDHDRNRVRTDKRYLLADLNQQTRLRRMFEAVHYQRSGAEKRAQDFDAAQETTAADQ